MKLSENKIARTLGKTNEKTKNGVPVDTPFLIDYSLALGILPAADAYRCAGDCRSDAENGKADRSGCGNGSGSGLCGSLGGLGRRGLLGGLCGCGLFGGLCGSGFLGGLSGSGFLSGLCGLLGGLCIFVCAERKENQNGAQSPLPMKSSSVKLV